MRRLVRLRTVPLDAQARRLGSCYDIADLRRAAKRRIPRPVFDYVDGAADEEIAVAANVAAFRSWRFLPRVLAGVASADTSAPVFSSTLPVPMVLGPTGYTRMLHPDGEIGGARSAAGTGCRTRCRRWRRPGSRSCGPAPGRRRRAVVPAVPDQGPGAVVRPGRPGRRARVHGAGGHGGHGRGGQSGAGLAQRAFHPARAHAGDDRLGRVQAVLLVPPAVRAAARLRQLRRRRPRRRFGRRPTSSTPT